MGDVLVTRQPTACDTDPARQALLEGAIPAAQAAVVAASTDENPMSATDPFWLAVYVRESLPDGLAAGDFDGCNVAAALGDG